MMQPLYEITTPKSGMSLFGLQRARFCRAGFSLPLPSMEAGRSLLYESLLLNPNIF